MTLTGWMVYALVVSLLVGGAAWSLDRGLALQRAPTRWIWLASLLLSIGVPLGGALFPSPSQGEALAESGLPATVSGASGVELGGALGSESEFLNAGPLLFLSRLGERVTEALRDGQALLPAGEKVQRGVAAAWITGSLAMAIVLLLAGATTTRRKRQWSVRRIRGRKVRVSPRMGPAVIGVVRPEIVLPAWAEWANPQELDLMLAHEEEHLRAGDPRLLALALLPLVLMPWNPSLWWQFRRLRDAVEVDCDRRVLARGAPAAKYGRLLLHLGSVRCREAVLSPAFAGSSSLLERRLKAMQKKSRRIGVPLSILAGVIAVGLVAVACEADAPAIEEEVSAAAQDPPRSSGTDPLPDRETGVAPSEAVGDSPVAADQPRTPQLTPPAAYDSVFRSEFRDVPVSELEAEAAAARMRDAPAFTPFEVAPQLRNAPSVQRILESEYPAMLRDAGVGGTVIVHFFIDETGAVGNAAIHESSGQAQLDAAALRAAREFEFAPALNRDRPVPVWVSIPVTFRSN
ncbi:MAG: M56 family metallopeptidase [Gemmatimonadota bacterium]